MSHYSENIMGLQLSRRRFTIVPAAVALTALLPTSGLAARMQGTPASHAHQTSTSEVDVTWTWTDTGAEITQGITAGWNRMSIVNNRSTDSPPTHVLSFRVGEDVTDQQIEDLVSSEDAPFPDWAREAYYPGIPDGVSSGASLEGYTHYVEGRYIWVDIFTGMGGEFMVGPGSWNRQQPAPDVHADMIDMDFLGLDDPLPSGTLLWEVANHGATWHEMVIMQLPDPMTSDEILKGLMSDENWPPTGYAIKAGYGITSPGSSGMIELSLDAGAYAALCMAPDNFEGPPHAMAGMIKPFMVD